MKKRILVALSALSLCVGLTACSSTTPKKEVVKENTNYVEVSISAEPVLKHKKDLKENKKDIVPEDGMLLKSVKVTLEKDDNAFTVLQRAAKENNIALDFDPAEKSAYNTVYVKGIAQLYGGDCGKMSGWMFNVDGKYGDKGADQTTVKKGEKIQWIFICDYNTDVKK